MIEHVFEDCNCSGKRCPGCEQVKCYGAFHRDRSTKGGLQVYCRVCKSVKSATCRQNSLEDYRVRERAQKQVHREANRERDREYQRTWQQNHPEYYRSESQRVYRKAYYETHREQYREQLRAWQQDHPERVAIYHANRRARRMKAGGSFTLRQWEDLKASYDYTCLCCCRQEPEITLVPDHVVPIAKGGTSNIENIQPLCLSCNASKKAKIVDYRP